MMVQCTGCGYYLSHYSASVNKGNMPTRGRRVINAPVCAHCVSYYLQRNRQDPLCGYYMPEVSEEPYALPTSNPTDSLVPASAVSGV